MAETTGPTAPMPSAGTKWWGRSMTIWGAALTAFSSVLPIVGTLVGLDITPELARRLGEELLLAAQAVAGVVGTILTIYGRVRATTPLGRRQWRRPRDRVRLRR